MSPHLSRWIELLQIDSLGRRAIEETRLDWIEESRAARTLRPRLVLAIRYLVALVSVTARVSLRQGWRSSFWLIMAFVTGCVFLPALTWTALAAPMRWANSYRLDLYVALLPGTALMLIPVGAFYAALLSRRFRSRATVAGLLVVVGAVSAVAVVVLPQANDHYGALTLWLLRDAPAGQPPVTLADSSIAEIFRALGIALAATPESRYAWLWNWVPMTMAAVVLGGALDRRSTRVRRAAGLGAVPIYVLTLLIVVSGFRWFWLMGGEVDHLWALVMAAIFVLVARLIVAGDESSIDPPRSPPAPSPPPHQSARSVP